MEKTVHARPIEREPRDKNRGDREGPNVAGTATLTHDRPKDHL
jgi:hypothetical protein